MQNKLQNKVAIITGGNSGIGYATAQEFKEQGATVIITGRRLLPLRKAAEELGAEYFLADQSDLSDTDKLVTFVKEKYGKVDTLVINAGFGAYIPLEQTTETQYDEIMNINFKGAYFTLSKFSPMLNDGAAVIFISSITASMAMLHTTVYAASKAAVNSLVKTSAVELAPRQIRVNAVSPGVTHTALFSKSGMDENTVNGLLESLKPQIPLRKIGTSAEVAKLITHLVSDDSTFITGAEYLIDGGHTIRQ